MGIEAERQLELHCPLGPDVLLIEHVHGHERLSDNFEYTLTLYSKNENIEAEDLLGQHATVRMMFGGHPKRFLDGIVCEFGPTGYRGRYVLYRMVLRPWFWLLSRTSECKVFQGKTTPEIFDEIVKDKWSFSDVDRKLMYALEPREYCVQYRESDLTFLMRLLEEDGIYFFFRHEDGKHTLVLADSVSAHDPAPDFEKIRFRSVREVDFEKPEGVMLSWMTNKRVQPGRVALTDYDFKKSKANLSAQSDDPKGHEHADSEIFDWPGRYVEAAKGQDRAKVRLEELHSAYELSEGSTDATGLYTGALFTLEGHKREAENHEYLIIAATYDADSGAFETGGTGSRFVAHIAAIDSNVPFRPARRAKRPIIAGTQTATVVGPKGSEIWTDEYGRVKVQFHWDRYGKNDEKSSCWVRVAQVWAGSKWGALFTPRIGHEVVVGFLEGNPDNPLIIGSVYNSTNMLPYDLPDNQTQSGWKTQSSKGGSRNDYNELRFEDKKGSEQIVFHAQKDMVISVEHDENHSVGNNLTVSVDKGYYATTVKEGYKRTEVPKNKSELFAKEIHEVADDKITMTVGASTIVIEPQQVTISVLKNTITLTPAGISLSCNGATTLELTSAGIAASGATIGFNS